MKLTFSDSSDYMNIVLRRISDLLEGVGSLRKRFKDY